MSKVVYQDSKVTEYDDGREEVRFSDKEWEIMRSDPAFGYIRRCGHKTTIVNGELIDTDCMECESGYYE